ncbi:ribonuclease D [Labrys wisconsinensis]|uniref:Ribonuclease D n=1 Tax=Labrys wisconsinensis TaxID=425677 RepID=A0ABU0J272_9HYPH|nr:ribonuclease D [Labrys wisconsinensis]MDQ0468350.1 ribonuclease D [Labrys wisconsinensis]
MTSIITTTADLTDACARLAQHPFVTVDTEFLRETTFWPKLCVVQVASPEEAVIVDALAEGIDLEPLNALLRNEAVLKVYHAARQDIEIVWHMAKFIPAPVFDTQVAAMVLGYGDSIAYDQLVQRLTGAHIDKSSRFTDWSKRPLTEAQIVYAISDVTHLRDVYLKLAAQLEKRKRAHWMQDEMAVLTSPETYRQPPEDAWKRIGGRIRKPRDLAILVEVSAWREREAQTKNVPRSRVLKDDAIIEIALQAPDTPEKLAGIRMIPKGWERSRSGLDLIDAVKAGMTRDPATLPVKAPPRIAANGAGATVELLKVLLKMVSERQGVAAKVIATTDDLDLIADNDEADVPALHGWRRELFGEKALALKRGKLALAIEKGRVTAIER